MLALMPARHSAACCSQSISCLSSPQTVGVFRWSFRIAERLRCSLLVWLASVARGLTTNGLECFRSEECWMWRWWSMMCGDYCLQYLQYSVLCDLHATVVQHFLYKAYKPKTIFRVHQRCLTALKFACWGFYLSLKQACVEALAVEQSCRQGCLYASSSSLLGGLSPKTMSQLQATLPNINRRSLSKDGTDQEGGHVFIPIQSCWQAQSSMETPATWKRHVLCSNFEAWVPQHQT